MTESSGVSSSATTPDSNCPRYGPPATKTRLIADRRPRSASGVSSCRIATSVDEGHERIKRPTAQLDRLAIGQQLSAMADDPEPAKFNGYGIFRQPCHGVDCSATLPDFPTLIAHRSEASRAFAATRSVVPNPSVKRR